MGAPKKHPPKDAATTIERMSAQAHGMVGIAKYFGVSRDTLKRWCEEDEALQEAYELGREIERQALHALIVADAAARKGSNGNAMFILKCKFGYRENDSNNTNVNVGVQVPTNVMIVRDLGTDDQWQAKAKRISNGNTFSKGISFLTSFTWAKLMVANGYLNNSGEWKVDAKPVRHWDGGNGAPTWALSVSGLYGLPFGQGAWLGSNAHGLVEKLIGDWQLDWIFQNRAGNATGIPNGDIFNCGSYDIKPAHKSWASYLNNSQSSCWANRPEYYIYTFDGTTSRVRQPWAQQTQLGLMKKFPIKDELNLQFKAEAFNATNTPIFGGPNGGGPEVAPTRITSVTNPIQPGAWQGYGTVGSAQQNFPRQFQFSLKLQF